jgi:hypothetical protein
LFFRFKQDFSVNSNRTYPTSCCASDITDHISISSHRPLASAVVFRTEDDLREHQLKANLSDIAGAAWNHVIPRDDSRSGGDESSGGALSSENKIIATCRAVYPQVELSIIIILSQLFQHNTRIVCIIKR